MEQGQQNGTWDVAKRPDVVDLAQIKEANFEDDRLVFYTELNDELIDRLSKLMTTLRKGKQWHWAAFWRKLEESGYEWTNYMPMDTTGRELISLSRAHTWLSVHDKFPVDTRIYANLVYSHYEAVRALRQSDAYKILDAANRQCITVAELGQVIKEMKGDPPKPKKPKLIQHPPCGNWIADLSEDGIPCPFCSLNAALMRINNLRDILTLIRDNDIPEVGQALRFDVDTAIKALEV